MVSMPYLFEKPVYLSFCPLGLVPRIDGDFLAQVNEWIVSLTNKHSVADSAAAIRYHVT